MPLTEPVVRADDSQRTRGDRGADELGALQQLGDGVAQVLATDLEDVGFPAVADIVIGDVTVPE